MKPAVSKHVDVVVKFFYPVAAGIETNILETYSVLVQKGWDVVIHTSKDTLTEKNILKNEEMYRGLQIRRYEYKPWGYVSHINWLKTNLVCLHNFNILPHLLILVRSLLLKVTGKKKFGLILTPHGGFTPDWNIFGPERIIKYLYHRTLGAFLVNTMVDKVRAVSEWEKEEMIKYGIKRDLITVISNGIEDEAYLDVEKEASKEIKEKVNKYGNYILQMGRIYKIKNYETTIRALALLPDDINFVIAGPIGNNQYLKKLQSLAKSLNVEQRIFFVGVIRGVDKYYLIKKAQMMVHMAHWESFCNVIHEGMSQGLVCVVANNTALPYLIKDGVNGYCLETTDYKAVADKVKFILENKSSTVIKKMQTTNAEFGLKDSWTKVAGKMDRLYETVITNI